MGEGGEAGSRVCGTKGEMNYKTNGLNTVLGLWLALSLNGEARERPGFIW